MHHLTKTIAISSFSLTIELVLQAILTHPAAKDRANNFDINLNDQGIQSAKLPQKNLICFELSMASTTSTNWTNTSNVHHFHGSEADCSFC
jgi:hypothetical protein